MCFCFALGAFLLMVSLLWYLKVASYVLKPTEVRLIILIFTTTIITLRCINYSNYVILRRGLGTSQHHHQHTHTYIYLFMHFHYRVHLITSVFILQHSQQCSNQVIIIISLIIYTILRYETIYLLIFSLAFL